MCAKIQHIQSGPLPRTGNFFNIKKMLDFFGIRVIIQKLSEQRTKYGGIAQLGERLNGIQEVSGSIPLISTKTLKRLVFDQKQVFFLTFLQKV